MKVEVGADRRWAAQQDSCLGAGLAIKMKIIETFLFENDLFTKNSKVCTQ
jgi:hypothetical protein